MKAQFFLLAAAMALLSAGCGGTADQSTNASPAANARDATAGTAQQAPTATPTPEKKTEDAGQSKTVTVRFPTGATEASYTDSFSGYGTVDYKFDAKAAQKLTAEITSSDKDKAILTVMRNGAVVESDASMVQGWTGVLPANGSYMIRVGQMRNDARNGNTPVKFGLRIQIVNSGQ